MASFKETLSLPAANLARDRFRSEAEGDLCNDSVGADDDDLRNSLEPECHRAGVVWVDKYDGQIGNALDSLVDLRGLISQTHREEG